MTNVLAQDARLLRDPNGALVVTIDNVAVTLATSDIEIGGVELKDGSTDNRAAISAAGRVSVDASGVAVPVTDNNTTLSVDDGAGSLTIDGTVTANAGTGPFPVSDNAGSLTVDAPVGTPAFVRLSDGAAALVGQKAMASSLPVAVASDQGNVPVSQATAASLNATVTQQTLTKGTQGATGVSTQDLKDAGRAAITITGYQVAGIITTEALFSAAFVRAADGVVAGAAAQHTVTAGKRFRVQSVVVTVKNTAAAAGTSKLALRYRPAGGTVAITDSIVAILDIGSNNATANNYIGPYVMEIPDGFEMVASSTFGFTNLSGATSMLHTITLTGFEY